MHWGFRLGELVNMDIETEECLELGVTSSGNVWPVTALLAALPVQSN